MSHSNRRAFLKQASSLAVLGSAAPLGLNFTAITEAAAQSSSNAGYKALVCIFLNGGNDAFNTVLATDDISWGHYSTHRNPANTGTSVGLPRPGVAPNANATSVRDKMGGTLPISHSGRAANAGREFALHPALTHLRQLHQSGRLAVLANVGPLYRPTSKADWYNTRIAKPIKLFSHNDQQSTWQSFEPEGANTGWAGLMGDLLMSANGTGRNDADSQLIRRSFTCMTPSNSSVWLAGNAVLPYQSSSTGILGLGNGSSSIYGSTRLHTAVSNIMGRLNANNAPLSTPANMFAADHQKLVQRALSAYELLGPSLAPLGQTPWSTSSITSSSADPLMLYASPVDGALKLNPLAQQLQMVVRLIATNQMANLGMSRQFFMVNLNGFDTHSNQINDHAERLAQLNHAMAYFDTVLANMPGGDMRNQVTTFTASEFGRTFTANGDGTDHGWGGHQFMMGGAVNGTDVYGTFPTYSTANVSGVFSSPDQIHNGVVIPTTSVDQYAYTLGKWMGVSDTNLRAILPNLRQFNSSTYDLGFLQA